MSDFSSLLFKGSKRAQGPKTCSSGRGRKVLEVTQQAAAPWGMGDPSTQQAQRNAVHKAWLAHLGEHTLLFTGSEWLTKEMWKLQQHAWLHSYSAGNIIQMPRVLNSSQYLEEWEEPELTGQVISNSIKNLIFTTWKFFACLLLLLSCCLLVLTSTAFWARILRDSYPSTKSFATHFFQEHISPLCPDQ